MTDQTDGVADDPIEQDSGRLPEQTETESEIEELVSYEENGDLVVCDRSNPRAWIKSECVEQLRE